MSVKLENKSNCRTCLKQLDGATSLKDEKNKPREGDFSCCFYCATISRFDKDLNLVPATTADIEELERNDPEALILLQQAAFYIRKRNAQN